MLEGQTYSNKMWVCVAPGSHGALIHQAGPRRPQLNFVTQLFLCRLKAHSSIPLHSPFDYVCLLFSSLAGVPYLLHDTTGTNVHPYP